MRLIDRVLAKEVSWTQQVMYEKRREASTIEGTGGLTDRDLIELLRKYDLWTEEDDQNIREDDDGSLQFIEGGDTPSRRAQLQRLLETKGNELGEEIKKLRKSAHQKRREYEKSSRTVADLFSQICALSTVIDGQNVYHYMRANGGDIYDMPCITSKWPNTWVEWVQDNGVVIGVQANQLTAPEMEIFDGDAFIPDEIDDALDPDNLSDSDVIELEKINGFRATKNGLWFSNNLPTREAWEAVKWMVKLDAITAAGKVVIGPVGSWTLVLDDYGHCLDMIWGRRETIAPEDTVEFIRVWAQTMAFLNLRNVRTVYSEPSRALQKKHRRKHPEGKPLVGVRKLAIDPMGPARGTRSEPHEGESLSEFHIHPGSFAHYGACCPPHVHAPKGLLFGRLSGIYWRPAHLKGNPRNGIKLLEYEVKEPQPEPT